MNVYNMMSPRLKMIADMVDKSKGVLDIGTDHAYIPIYLVQCGKAEFAIASDIKKGPIERAQRNIELFEVKNVRTVLSDGMKDIDMTGIDTVIIAGMGGMLISDIIKEGWIQNVKAFLLQPMTAQEKLRKYLYESGFEITGERLCREGSKYYCIIKAKKSEEKTEYEEIDLYIGKRLIENRDPLLYGFICKKINETNKILAGMEKSKRDGKRKEKYEFLLSEYERILEGIGC